MRRKFIWRQEREVFMKKKYKAVFFDWDGTAVLSRKAPVEEIVGAMRPLLDQKVNLVIVSGTTIENIAGGKHQSLAVLVSPCTPFQGTLENRVLTSDWKCAMIWWLWIRKSKNKRLTSHCCAEIIWCSVLHIENLNCWISM